ncbi:hypothetical protein CDL15_Pgr015028 [Punica granatum]|uniref:Uncharacterized protein n=1 Tax=Punica granatum TaxID=22663 RepID=A0A218X0F2_PUNGR|nr:hypothetical protein CDL15_Pgr015028 [Punica granatum]
MRVALFQATLGLLRGAGLPQLSFVHTPKLTHLQVVSPTSTLPKSTNSASPKQSHGLNAPSACLLFANCSIENVVSPQTFPFEHPLPPQVESQESSGLPPRSPPSSQISLPVLNSCSYIAPPKKLHQKQ